MNPPPKKKKRIVSKGQYVQALGKRIGISSGGCLLLLLAALCAGVTLISFFIGPLGVLLGLAFGVLTFFIGKWGFESLHHMTTIHPGIPLTRKVADTLPAEESLVRASEEPIQEQQAVLLRASTDATHTPADQLVRPAGEPEP